MSTENWLRSVDHITRMAVQDRAALPDTSVHCPTLRCIALLYGVAMRLDYAIELRERRTSKLPAYCIVLCTTLLHCTTLPCSTTLHSVALP